MGKGRELLGKLALRDESHVIGTASCRRSSYATMMPERVPATFIMRRMAVTVSEDTKRRLA
jgi:hypothetical protein